MSNKWAISKNGENYFGFFDTIEEAINEASANAKKEQRKYWVGQCISPIQPEYLWFAEDWIDYVLTHDDYSGEWAEDSISATKEQYIELEKEVRKVLSTWLDKHELRPKHYNIDPKSVVEINAN